MGIAPFLLAPRAGALADRVGVRWLAVTGLILQTAGASWIAAISTPTVSYPALITPMTLVGVAFGIAAAGAAFAAAGGYLPREAFSDGFTAAIAVAAGLAPAGIVTALALPGGSHRPAPSASSASSASSAPAASSASSAPAALAAPARAGGEKLA